MALSRRAGTTTKNVTESIVQMLKLVDLPVSVMNQTQEELDLLKVRNPIGCFGRYDHERKRACALLEYIVREECGMKLSMDQLAKVSYMNQKAFVRFHETIGNFRNRRIQKTKKNPPAAAAASSVNDSASCGQSSRSCHELQKSSIPLLAVQLGTFVPNINATIQKAQVLFQKIQSHLKRHKRYRERIASLEDIQRKQAAYEAACFYLTATNGKWKPSGSTQRSIANHATTTMSTASGVGEPALDIDTLMEATNSFSQREFETILKYVRELQQEIQLKLEEQQQQQKSKDRNLSIRHPPQSSKKRNASTTVTAAASVGESTFADAMDSSKRHKTLRTTSRVTSTRDRSTKTSNTNTNTSTEVLRIISKQMEESSSWNQEQQPQQQEDVVTTLPKRLSFNTVFAQWKQSMILVACRDAQTMIATSKTLQLTENDDGKNNNSSNREKAVAPSSLTSDDKNNNENVTTKTQNIPMGQLQEQVRMDHAVRQILCRRGLGNIAS